MSLKLYGVQAGETYYIDEIPLHTYLWILNYKRKLNKELTVEYTKEIYGINLEDIIGDSEYIWYKDGSIYEDFENKNPRKKTDDGSREYFDNYGKRYFLKFAKSRGLYDEDQICPQMFRQVIHHIYPLVYGGNSDLRNLIQISRFNHDLLHNNPLEETKECCHKAVDYLSYLYETDGMEFVIKKYNLTQYKGSDSSFLVNMLKACIEQEMKEFYSRLSSRYGMVNV